MASEDKIDLKKGHTVGFIDENGVRYVGVGDLGLVLTDLYRQANEIGWETRVLDPLIEYLVYLRNYQSPPKP